MFFGVKTVGDTESKSDRLLDWKDFNTFEDFSSVHADIMEDKVAQPILVEAPTGAAAIDEFIAATQEVENNYSESERCSTRSMITRLRKYFYNTSGWNRFLIKKTEHINDVPFFERIYTTAEYVPFKPIGFKIRRPTSRTNPDPPPELTLLQEVSSADGYFVDMGHILTGLDAANNRNRVNILFLPVAIADNRDAVTWVGDLGSVLAELEVGFRLKRIQGWQDIQMIIDTYSPAKDMLGNLDSYVIANDYEINMQTNGPRVSSILEDYYKNSEKTSDLRYSPYRYAKFAKMVGLKNWNGSFFSNEDKWLAYRADEINDAAALYIGVRCQGLGKLPFATKISLNKSSKFIANLFLKSLKERLVDAQD